MNVRSTRGPYAKSAAVRERILQVALALYASSGRQGPTLREVAGGAGLSEAGVLHHFGTKDDLLVAVLRARDAQATAEYELTSPDGVWQVLAANARTPGLVKLYVDMAAAAADPAHPARAYMLEHRSGAVDLLHDLLPAQSRWAADLLVAAADGLQVFWLLDPTTDIVGELRRLHRALTEASPPS